MKTFLRNLVSSVNFEMKGLIPVYKSLMRIITIMASRTNTCDTPPKTGSHSDACQLSAIHCFLPVSPPLIQGARLSSIPGGQLLSFEWYVKYILLLDTWNYMEYVCPFFYVVKNSVKKVILSDWCCESITTLSSCWSLPSLPQIHFL